MADILIRGMEMPKENEILVFDVWHGKMYARSTANTGARRYEVVSLPEGHGDLIDRDALKKRTPMVIDYSAGGFGTDGAIRPVRGYGDWQIDQAPTIVPAEGGTDDD